MRGRSAIAGLGAWVLPLMFVSRNVLGLADASHAESDVRDAGNVIHALACSLQGEERLVCPIAGTRFARLVNEEPFDGMH